MRGRVLLRADSAFYSHTVVGAAVTPAPRCRSPSGWTPTIKTAIAAIPDDGWTTIEYTDAVFDEHTGQLDVARRGRRDAVHRVHRATPRHAGAAAGWSCAEFPTSTGQARAGSGNVVRPVAAPRVLHHHRVDVADTVAADRTHRGHAIIEQVHADLKSSALAHLPSGRFAANAAWLVLAVMAFNLTRAAATLTGPALAKATTATIRRTADRRARPDRHLRATHHAAPTRGVALADRLDRAVHQGQRPAARWPCPDQQPNPSARPETQTWNARTSRSGASAYPRHPNDASRQQQPAQHRPSVDPGLGLRLAAGGVAPRPVTE